MKQNVDRKICSKITSTDINLITNIFTSGKKWSANDWQSGKSRERLSWSSIDKENKKTLKKEVESVCIENCGKIDKKLETKP